MGLLCTLYALFHFIWISQHAFKVDIIIIISNFHKIIADYMNYMLITKVQTVQI